MDIIRKKKLLKKMLNKHLFNYMKKGLFVGSFNPITIAHKNIANYVLENQYIDYLYFLPVNSKKTDLISIDKRIAMINLIKKGQEDILNIYNYSKDGLFNYNILKKINNKININYIIMGSDLFLNFHNFKNYEKILEEFTIIVINRNKNIKKYIKDNYSFYLDKIIFIKHEFDGSSLLAKKELSLNKNNYLDKEVLDYIIENKLYQ